MAAVVAALAEKDRFLVTSHEAPDGDALGSLLATELALRSLGKDAVAEVRGTLSAEPAGLELEEAVLARKRRLSTEEHDDVLAELLQGEPHAEKRAERVAVGRLVRGHDEAVVVA